MYCTFVFSIKQSGMSNTFKCKWKQDVHDIGERPEMWAKALVHSDLRASLISLCLSSFLIIEEMCQFVFWRSFSASKYTVIAIPVLMFLWWKLMVFFSPQTERRLIESVFTDLLLLPPLVWWGKLWRHYGMIAHCKEFCYLLLLHSDKGAYPSSPGWEGRNEQWAEISGSLLFIYFYSAKQKLKSRRMLKLEPEAEEGLKTQKHMPWVGPDLNGCCVKLIHSSC